MPQKLNLKKPELLATYNRISAQLQEVARRELCRIVGDDTFASCKLELALQNDGNDAHEPVDVNRLEQLPAFRFGQAPEHLESVPPGSRDAVTFFVVHVYDVRVCLHLTRGTPSHTTFARYASAYTVG